MKREVAALVAGIVWLTIGVPGVTSGSTGRVAQEQPARQGKPEKQEKGAKQDKPVDVTGTWLFEVATSGGSGSPTFTFTQQGERLTGRYQGQFGEADVTGTVKDRTIKFSFDVSVQGTTVTVRYEGTVEGDTMKGQVNYGDVAEGTFTAKKKS